MFTTDLVHRPPVDWPARPAPKRSALAPSFHQLSAPVRSAIFAARRALLARQSADGSWLAPPYGDGSLAGPLVLLLAFLGEDESDLAQQAAHAIRADQMADGAWSRTPDGPADVSVSVVAYFALKFVGDEPSEPHMRRARDAIRRLGGADAADATTRRWLALLGQVDYDACPATAPEWLLLSDRGQELLLGDQLTAAERRRQTALAVIWALRPTRTFDRGHGIRELFLQPSGNWPALKSGTTQTSRVWMALSQWCERSGLLPLRPQALALAETLLIRHALEAETCEADFEEVLWHVVALQALGYDARSSAFAACEARLSRLIAVDDLDAARPHPATNSLADTLHVLTGLVIGGVAPTHSQLARAAAWLVHRLSVLNAAQRIESIADLATLMTTVRALTNERAANHALPPEMQLTQDRMARFLARQRNFALPLRKLRHLADSACDALLDRLPSAEEPRELGVALEALASSNSPRSRYAVPAAAIRLRIAQCADGSWPDTNRRPCVSATASAIRGLMAMGASADEPTIAAGVQWLGIEQLESGAWGDMLRTAEAVSALVVAGAADHDACRRGVQFLIDGCGHALRADDPDIDLNTTAAVLSALSRWAIAAECIEDTPISLRLVGN